MMVFEFRRFLFTILLLVIFPMIFGRPKPNPAHNAPQPVKRVAEDYLTRNMTTCPDCWSLHTTKGIMRYQSLIVRNYPHPTNNLHSCYEITCDGKHCPAGLDSTIRICYPAIIVTALPKCGTSAMYDLLSRIPGAVVMHEKENCPYARRRTHWQFFSSLPRYEAITKRSVIIDGCIDTSANLMMRSMLRSPKTLYVVMVRNYADMLWSSYNFWCNREYDRVDCDSTHWVRPLVHVRSPELFHEIVLGDFNGTGVRTPLFIKRACVFAGGYYSEYLKLQLWPKVPRNATIVVASEELEVDPGRVWMKVAALLLLDKEQSNPQLGNFTNIRVNSQENKGGTHSVLKRDYKPGLFQVSGYKPMMPETREILDKCWQSDCKVISQAAGYLYPACIGISMDLISLGAWHSFKEIYQSNIHNQFMSKSKGDLL